MVRILLSILVLFSFTHCLLQPKEPPNLVKLDPNQKINDTIAVFQMYDVYGVKNQSYVLAQFQNKVDASTEPKALVRNPRLAVNPVRGQEPEVCTIRKELLLRKAETWKAVSAGRVGVGIVGAGRLMLLPEDSNHQYGALFDHQVAPGLYQVLVEGSNDVRPFSVSALSMPEVMENIHINDLILKASRIQTVKKDDWTLSWTTPAIPNDITEASLRVVAQGESDVTILDCAIIEPMQGSSMQWKIPYKYISQLPATENAQIALFRIMSHRTGNDHLTAVFQGARVYSQYITIEEN